MYAKPRTKQALSLEGKTITTYLNTKKISMAGYFKLMAGQVDVPVSQYVKSTLYHMKPEDK